MYRKKVCHIISGYYRLDARVFLRQCKTLKKKDFEVIVLTNDGNGDEVIDSIPFYDCPIHLESRLKVFIFAKKQFIKKAIEIDADIYQIHSPELIGLGLSLKRMGKKVIYDAHEDLPRHILEKEWIPRVLRRVISIAAEFYLNHSLKRFDFNITPHTHVYKNFSKKGIKVELIENFPLVKKSKNFTLEQYLKRKNTICYTGTVYSFSNQQTIVKALKDLDYIRYEIAGFIENNEHLKLRSSLQERFKFWGRLTPPELSLFYRNSKIGFVLYDYLLNLGGRLGSYGTNKIFEYMEEGLPFICTDYVLWKNICDKYRCGIYIEPGNFNELKKTILWLINNPTIAYNMGQNGKRAVREEYNWNFVEEKYLNIFKNI